MICAAISVGGCDGSANGDDETYVVESPAAEPPCEDPLADPVTLARDRAADRALKAALKRGNADPVEEAHRAAASGDFRLVAAVTLDGIDTREFGALCVLRGGLSPRMARVVTYFGDGDDADAAPDPQPTALATGEAEDSSSVGLTVFARAFNRTLMADPAYPYRDVCRPIDSDEADVAADESAKAGVSVVRAVGEAPGRAYGYGDLGPLTSGATLADAARRGNVRALSRLVTEEEKGKGGAASASPEERIAEQVAVIDKPDLFGMTPLAWAIAYRRDGAARYLLDHHASPSGAQCQALVDRDSPMQIARAMGWVPMVLKMKPRVSEDDYAALAEDPRLVEGNKGKFNDALSKLGDHYGDIFNKDEMTRHTLTYDVDPHGRMSGCRFDPASASPEFDKELCKLGKNTLEWSPARDAEGRPSAGKGVLHIRLRGS